ncbi:MAG: hypothetical protein H7834_10520 [Magnetococcus sp. YQC-9]
MTPEQHEQLIDQLFKRINQRGEGVEQTTGEAATNAPNRGRGTRRSAEHVDPFAIEDFSADPDHRSSTHVKS